MEHTSSAPADTYFVMSIALAKYQRTLKGWKVYSSATVSIQRVMKVGDRYVPYSDDTQNLK